MKLRGEHANGYRKEAGRRRADMEKNRGICFVRNAGAVLLIVVTMMIGAVVFMT